MKPFLDLRLRAKLFVVFGLILALFAAALWNAYATLTSLVDLHAQLQEKQADAAEVARMDSNRNESRVEVLTLLNAAPEERAAAADRVRLLADEIDAIQRRLMMRNAADPEIASQLREYGALSSVYRTTRANVLDLALAGRLDEARQIALGQQNDRFRTLRQMGDALAGNIRRQRDAALAQSQAAVTEAKQFYLLVGAGVLIGSAIAIWGLGRMISNPLQQLVAAAQRISTGDLRGSVSLGERDDEVGVLARSFQTMLENLRGMQREIQEGVTVLASSASEIFTATAQIAASATETATAVSQTTTTAEEVKQTAQVSAQKAGNVADIAQRAAQSAQSGRKAIDESIAGMRHLREQMEQIAETVVRLSEQSQAIGDITSSVNDLAEQSNLLAVNASIEAAKAGEHGKGFAVVAHEIRNLATQSKESTAQIRSILHEIQRATTATVMAAEQGSKAVDAGVKQVNQSGEAIRALTESIMSAAQAATQITASTQEQLIGIDQVTIAIQNILQASKQNATGTQQAEVGAKNLNQLGQNLKLVAQRFTV